MIAKRREECIILFQAEPVEEAVVPASARPGAELRRKWLSLIFLILALSIIIVAQNDHLVRNGYKLVKMKEYAAELEKENQTLRIDIAKLKSPERIEDIATHQLGLVWPGTESI